MKRIRRNLCKIAAFFVTAFILSSGLTSASAAEPVSKPVKINELAEGGFFILTFQSQIHPSLPEFSFDLYGISIGRGYVYQARRIIVTETETKNPVQEISLDKLNDSGGYPTNTDWETMGFVIEDMNFDGYQDVRIVAFLPGGSRIPYFYWFWDNFEEKFTRYRELESITSPVFDPVTKTIRSPVNIHGEQSYDIVYKYVDFVPTTKEDYLKNIDRLERTEAGLADYDNAEKKKKLNNCYQSWNEELTNILSQLEREMTPEEKKILKANQKQWLSGREKLAKEAASKQPNNPLAHNYSLLQLTKSRTMELINLFFDGEKK